MTGTGWRGAHLPISPHISSSCLGRVLVGEVRLALAHRHDDVHHVDEEEDDACENQNNSSLRPNSRADEDDDGAEGERGQRGDKGEDEVEDAVVARLHVADANLGAGRRSRVPALEDHGKTRG